jgi:hypothetical protein
MKSAAQSSANQEVTGMEADGRASDRDDMLILGQRLDRLQRQMHELNDALMDYSERKRLHRQRRSANSELMRFSQQARKLAHYAPY